LIVHWPGVTAPGSVNDELVTSTDFYPTIMEMVTGSEQPDNRDGQTIVPLLRGENEITRDTLYWHYPHYSNAGSPPCSAIRENEYKLIEFHEDESLELYNLAEDIGETTNLASEMPDLTRRLYDKLQSWQNELDVKMPWPNPDYNSQNTG